MKSIALLFTIISYCIFAMSVYNVLHCVCEVCYIRNDVIINIAVCCYSYCCTRS
jgi:hypothetical protein